MRPSAGDTVGAEPEGAPNRSAVHRTLAGRIGGLAVLTAVVWWVFSPGTFNPDSLDICSQAFTGVIHDWHTPILAWMWNAVKLRPGALLLGVIAAFVIGVHIILSLRLRPLVAMGATWAVVLFPVSVSWLGVQGKDAWLATALIASIASFVWAGCPQRSGRTRWTAIGLGLVFTWVAIAARRNAVIPMAAVLLIAVPWTSILRQSVTGWTRIVLRFALTAAVLGAMLLSQSALNAMVVHPDERHVEQATYQFDLAGLSIRTGEILFPDGTLRPGSTLEDLEAAFVVGEGDGFFFGEATPLVYPIAEEETIARLRDAWSEAVVGHPLDYLRHRAAYAGALTGLTQSHPVGALWAPDQDSADWGLACPDGDRDHPGVYSRVESVLRDIEGFPLMRGWVFMVLLIAGGFLAGIRRPDAASLVAAGLLNEATFAIGGISPTFRYSWITAICALLVLALSLDRFRWARAVVAPEPDGPVMDADPEPVGPESAEHEPIAQEPDGPGRP